MLAFWINLNKLAGFCPGTMSGLERPQTGIVISSTGQIAVGENGTGLSTDPEGDPMLFAILASLSKVISKKDNESQEDKTTDAKAEGSKKASDSNDTQTEQLKEPVKKKSKKKKAGKK